MIVGGKNATCENGCITGMYQIPIGQKQFEWVPINQF